MKHSQILFAITLVLVSSLAKAFVEEQQNVTELGCTHVSLNFLYISKVICAFEYVIVKKCVKVRNRTEHFYDDCFHGHFGHILHEPMLFANADRRTVVAITSHAERYSKRTTIGNLTLVNTLDVLNLIGS